ncbi:MAG: hypothetical protein J1D89_06320 [Agathobacter sp.]|nr:hypothetical protein [Agathobacter sp.]
MEKSWDDFWASGKVTDYLRYRNAVADREETNRENDDNGTASESDGHSTFGYGYR